jgi:hypothetical protein
MRKIPVLSRTRKRVGGRPWSEARLQQARADAFETAYRAGLLR